MLASISKKKSGPEKNIKRSSSASYSKHSSSEPEKNELLVSSNDVSLLVTSSETQSTEPIAKASTSTSGSVAISLFPIYCLLVFPSEKYVSLDCEMISIYSDPKHRDFMKLLHLKADLSKLAKGSPARSKFIKKTRESHGVSMKQVAASVAVVSENGTVIFFAHIHWEPKIVYSYQTEWSGITAKHLEGKKSIKEVNDLLLPLIKGKTVIGAAVHNDLNALGISHDQIWDIQTHYGQRKLSTLWAEKFPDKPRIQTGSHSAIVDARAAMALYKLAVWEPTEMVDLKDLASRLEDCHLG
ncbi:hypothetical protein B4U80_12227 [Leptotrombidium deliense]|uniref:Exonuclease domain-containing protein n=1 Tax=Leptotrombidium deliense TaxID=299467 RepID=A0A443RWX6_9ACAR|nr:hypothetical protein B4U80_12227 [Leptotrombidium deliense]